MMDAEREKLEAIKPLYLMAKALLPAFKLSYQNISYYASLVHYYTIHDLRQRIKPEQSYLYLLCFCRHTRNSHRKLLMEEKRYEKN